MFSKKTAAVVAASIVVGSLGAGYVAGSLSDDGSGQTTTTTQAAAPSPRILGSTRRR